VNKTGILAFFRPLRRFSGETRAWLLIEIQASTAKA
jgi:hypothetical protein